MYWYSAMILHLFSWCHCKVCGLFCIWTGWLLFKVCSMCSQLGRGGQGLWLNQRHYKGISVFLKQCSFYPFNFECQYFHDDTFKFLFLPDHLSKVFDMGEEEQDIILQKVQESKVRHFVHDSVTLAGLIHQLSIIKGTFCQLSCTFPYCAGDVPCK